LQAHILMASETLIGFMSIKVFRNAKILLY
jgi:hypothetical protein